jgi:hypothetical protein
MDKKVCSRCRTNKSLHDFYRNRTTKDGYAYECKNCKDSRPSYYWKTEKARAADRERYLRRISTPEGKASLLEKNRKYKQSEHGKLAEWKRYLKRNYKISLETYNKILEIQGGGCAICGAKPKERRLHIDHNHSTNAIRGILCGKCNQAIGLLNENLILFDRAKEYIKNNNNETVSRLIENNS